MGTHSVGTWEHFWAGKKKVDEVYPGCSDIVAELETVTGLNGKRILEVGAGTGRDSVRMAGKGGRVVILDYSPNALMLARTGMEKEGKTCFLVRADAYKLPFKNDVFDLVFHQGLLEHFAEPGGIVAENHRVLKKGGFMLADVPQKYHPYTVAKHLLMAIDKWFAGWETEYTPRQLRNLAVRHNFTVQRMYGNWMYPSFFYRVFREALLKLRLVALPRYPGPVPVLGALRKKVRCRAKQWPVLFNTMNAIGIIGKKP